ncbi:hypothetical protein Tco_0047083 [Tanacetum coccineum]
MVDGLEEFDPDCDDLQLNTSSIFKADHVDTFDSDCDKASITSTIFMARLSHAGSVNGDDVGPYYDTYHETDMLNPINDDAQSVPPPEQDNAMILSVIEQMQSQVKQRNTVNQETKSLNESLTSELERYKEKVKVLEERQKSEHFFTEREKHLDSQMRGILVDRNKKEKGF